MDGAYLGCAVSIGIIFITKSRRKAPRYSGGDMRQMFSPHPWAVENKEKGEGCFSVRRACTI